jgi:hypothetical protein
MPILQPIAAYCNLHVHHVAELSRNWNQTGWPKNEQPWTAHSYVETRCFNSAAHLHSHSFHGSMWQGTPNPTWEITGLIAKSHINARMIRMISIVRFRLPEGISV